MNTLIRTELDASGGRARIESRGGLLRPMVLSSSPAATRVALVAQGALLLAGDHVDIDVEVGPGCTLDIVEPSGTVAYDMRGADARWDVRITLHDKAKLVWHGEPFVVSEGALVRRSLRATMADSAQLFMRETLVLGRSGERPGRLRQATRIGDHEGPLIAEDLELSPFSQVGGVLGTNRVLESVIAFGTAPLECAQQDRMVLERNGAVWRRLGASAHTASLSPVWKRLTD